MHSFSEQDYDSIRELGRKLHIPTPEMFWGFQVEALADGKILHTHVERGHSWVRNAYNVLTSQMCSIGADSTNFGAGLMSLKTTAGAIIGDSASKKPLSSQSSYSAVSPETGSCGYSGAVADAASGIVVGTGTAVFSFEDFKLANQILHGTTSGKFSYQASNAVVRSYDVGTKILAITHSRIFNNNSGADIVVTEVGIHNIMNNPAGNSSPCLMVRDVLATPVITPNVAKLTITYTLSVAFPA